MKSALRYPTLIFGFTAVFCGFVAIYWFTGWPLSRYDGGLELPGGEVVKISNVALDRGQISELRGCLKDLPTMNQVVSTKPDLEIVVWGNPQDPEILSVWLDDGFIYDGHFLGAWTERMAHDSAPVFRIDGRTREFLKGFLLAVGD